MPEDLVLVDVLADDHDLLLFLSYDRLYIPSLLIALAFKREKQRERQKQLQMFSLMCVRYTDRDGERGRERKIGRKKRQGH